MVLEELVARHYTKDYFGMSLEKAGSFLDYLGLKQIGSKIKNDGILHQHLMEAHKCRIETLLEEYGFNERLLKRYLGWISGTIVLQRCCIENGYAKEFNEMHKKFKPSLRMSLFSRKYWTYDKNYLKNSYKSQ